jgi:folate-binding protein YgfZ
MEPAYLDDRAVLALAGPDARNFLQGLITNDIERLAPNTGLYAALLSPQGKMLFDFFLCEGDGALLLDCAAEASEALLKKLRLYRLRAKVEIEPRPQLGVYVNLAGHPANRPTPYSARAVTFPDPRLEALGSRSIGAVAEMPAGLAGPAAYHAARRALGVPESGDFGFEKVFALEAGLEELHGVSFTKGCYIGQELTSRMKHRATTRKRLLPLAGSSPLPAPGAAITQNGAVIGELISAHGRDGFAAIRLDRRGPGPALAGEIPVALTEPAWLA